VGTRNLTMVINHQGEKKVAQYGQWDGYPSGVGVCVLAFLRDKELFEKFKNNLSKVRFLDKEGVDKEFIESYDKNAPQWSNESDNRTEEQKMWFDTYCSRDLAEEVLTNIANSTDEEIILMDRESTAKGDGWVEYSYVINLQENTLGVYGHIDQDPMKVYSLDNLPKDKEFISDIKSIEAE
jgi:hypothetical protein